MEIAFALDTFYAVMSGALVMFMAAGFTMLEAGLVQKKDVSEIVTKNIGLYSIACIMYLVCGFMVMYPGSAIIEGYLPAFSLASLGLSTALPNEEIGMPYGMDYSQQADFFFQVVFVATAMSIVSGAVAGRMKLIPFFLFAIVLTGVIYPIQGYWNWGGGFLSSMGYSDYAGSGTVHLCGAAAALAVVLVLGPRNGKYAEDGTSLPMPGSNIPMAALGVWILWLGWFGFNGGSELIVSTEASAIAVSQVFLNTNMAASGGVVAAILMSLILTGKMDVTMAMNGAIAGLVAISTCFLLIHGGKAPCAEFMQVVQGMLLRVGEHAPSEISRSKGPQGARDGLSCRVTRCERSTSCILYGAGGAKALGLTGQRWRRRRRMRWSDGG